MKIPIKNNCLPLSPKLTLLIERLVQAKDYSHSEIILNFRDPGYSSKNGGYHPVEISISKSGQLHYITDFSYAGQEPFVELVKNLDFDVRHGLFQHFGHEYPLCSAHEIFKTWQSSFLQYHAMNVYEVSINQS